MEGNNEILVIEVFFLKEFDIKMFYVFFVFLFVVNFVCNFVFL